LFVTLVCIITYLTISVSGQAIQKPTRAWCTSIGREFCDNESDGGVYCCLPSTSNLHSSICQSCATFGIGYQCCIEPGLEGPGQQYCCNLAQNNENEASLDEAQLTHNHISPAFHRLRNNIVKVSVHVNSDSHSIESADEESDYRKPHAEINSYPAYNPDDQSSYPAYNPSNEGGYTSPYNPTRSYPAYNPMSNPNEQYSAPGQYTAPGQYQQGEQENEEEGSGAGVSENYNPKKPHHPVPAIPTMTPDRWLHDAQGWYTVRNGRHDYYVPGSLQCQQDSDGQVRCHRRN